MSEWVWAIDENGHPCKCYAKPENRGKGSCKHQFHQEPGQSMEEFFASRTEMHESVTREEVNDIAAEIDKICGTRVTVENYDEVIRALTPEQLDKLNKIGFEAAPKFSLPITDEKYDEENESNKIYFAELPYYGIGGKKNAMRDMFGSIGPVPCYVDDVVVDGNYRDGLTQRQYFEKIFSTRSSQIAKTVSVAAPGAAARDAFYGLADMELVDDCGDPSSDGILHCKAPGVCKKCAAKSGWNTGNLKHIGSQVSTHLTEGLTQASLNAIHTGDGKKQHWEVIVDTMHNKASSPVTMKARDAKTTEEARQIVYEGLKESYASAGIRIDQYNLEVLAKRLTSFKRDENTGQLRYVKEGELCDLPNIRSIGGRDNLFLQSLLKNSYSKITSPTEFVNTKNSVTSIA